MQVVNFRDASSHAAADGRLTGPLTTNTLRQFNGRRLRMLDLPNPDALRDLAGRIKQHTLDHLDHYLEQLCDSVAHNGGKVHFAADADEARRIILQVARAAGCSRMIKSKSMVSEEIELLPHLERAGIDVVETDLGEFIIQISHDRPSHLVAPIIHMDRAAVGRILTDYFRTAYTDDPVTLTRQARDYLRGKFRASDIGMTGGNFLIAQTGQVCVVENEGNARQSMTTPRVLLSLVGIEKVIPRLEDVAVMLKLLARSSTGQAMTIYTSLFGGPRGAGERDGPQEFHLVLLDNGRSRLLKNPGDRELLRCIRCGACLNACPVYRKIGGHPYNSVYPGPIGALITPLLRGLPEYKDLPQASSLCGACYEACPVKIDIPRHLVRLRTELVQTGRTGRGERWLYRAWARCMSSPRLYRLSAALQRWDLRRRAGQTGWVKQLPRIAAGWTKVRDLPAPAPRSFHQLWKDRS